MRKISVSLLAPALAISLLGAGCQSASLEGADKVKLPASAQADVPPVADGEPALFSAGDSGNETRRVTKTPEGVPENAYSVSDESECSGQTVTGPSGGPVSSRTSSPYR